MTESTATMEKVSTFSIAREPVATLTNVAFLIAAILIALKGMPGATALVASLTLLFMGSTAFHGFGSKTGGLAHIADVGSLYVVAGVVVYHAWAAELWILIAAMIVVGGLTLTIGRLKAAYPVIAATAIIIAGIWVNFGMQAAVLPLVIGLAAFAARLLAGRFDKQGNKKMDDLFHGIWHVLIAAAVYTAWLATVS